MGIQGGNKTWRLLKPTDSTLSTGDMVCSDQVNTKLVIQ